MYHLLYCTRTMYALLFPGPKVQGQGDFGSMDIASVGDTSDSHNMDSEDLVPSLQVCTTHSRAVTASPAPPPSQHALGVARSLHIYGTALVTQRGRGHLNFFSLG